MILRIGNRNLLVWLTGPKKNLTNFKLRKSKCYDIMDIDIHLARNGDKFSEYQYQQRNQMRILNS